MCWHKFSFRLRAIIIDKKLYFKEGVAIQSHIFIKLYKPFTIVLVMHTLRLRMTIV